MKLVQNEQGSALILVLLITVVFTILGLSLVSMNITNTKQLSHREADLQATNLAEMGIDLYVDYVQRAVDETAGDIADFISDGDSTPTDEVIIDKLIELIKENLDDKINSQETIVYEDDVKYSFKVQDPDDSNKNYYIGEEGTNNDKIIISFLSTGIVDNNKEKTLAATFTISKRLASGDTGSGGGSDADNCISGGRIIRNCMTAGDVTYENLIKISGNSSLSVNGDATFTRGLTLNGNPAKLCVNGNLTVSGGPLTSNGNRAEIYVKGTFNIESKDDDVIIIVVDTLEELEAQCGSFGDGSFGEDSFQWLFDSDLNIEYIYGT